MPNRFGLGKEQRKALRFIAGCNSWCTYAKDAKRVVMSLVKRELVEVNEFSQFQITSAGKFAAGVLPKEK